MPPTVTYALLGVLALVFAFGLWVEYRPEHSRWTRLRRWSLGFQAGALVLAVLLLRPGHGTHRTVESVTAAIGDGTPTLIDVYSNW